MKQISLYLTALLALVGPGLAQAQMGIDLVGDTFSPQSIQITDTDGSPATIDGNISLSGQLTASGNLSIYATAANVGSANWSNIGNALTISTEADVAGSTTGWGAVAGSIRKDAGGQLVAITFDLSGLDLSGGGDLVLQSFSTDTTSTGIEYFVDGVSVANVDPDTTGGTVYTVNSTITDGQRIAWSGDGASEVFKVSQIQLAIVGGDPGPTAPSISSQPQDASVYIGSSHELTVSANGSEPLSYQWFKNGDLLAAETASTLLLENLTLSDSGDTYHVTVSNEHGSIQSDTVTVSVLTTLKGTRPNIIFFLGDDQNITDQSAYGNPNVPTPTTDTLADHALVFDRMFTPQAICAPSRSALYSGRYPIRNGAFINHRLIRPRIQTLPTYLQPLGYNVILAGKSHVGPDSQFPWTHEWGSLNATEGRPHGWIPITQIETFLANPGPDPFCMMITSHYPHPTFITNKAYTVNGVTIEPGSPNYVPYHASIAEKEAELAAVLAAVEANGLAGNTIIFFADDHGNNGKFTVYDRGLNVAHMVRWPGKIEPGRTGALTSFVDFVPTAIELAGGIAPATLDGKSLVPLLEGGEAVLHEYVYGVAVNQGIIKRKVFPQRSIRDTRYHYIWNFNSLERINREGITNYFYVHGAEWFSNIPEEELYDTQIDPSESNNLADQPEYAELKATMKAQLFSWMRDQSDYLYENQSSPFLYIPNTRYHLDVDADGDPVPEELKGTMDGQMVDPHEITDPNHSMMDSDYGVWLIEHNLFGSQTFDEDGDGYSNLYEYAMAGEPADPNDHGQLPVLNVESTGGSLQIHYSHAKRLNASGLVSYSLQGRADLVSGTWDPVSSTTESAPLNAEYETVTHLTTLNPDEMFLRLRIEAPN